MTPRDELPEAALRYAAGGLPIFPIAENRSKPPCIERWPELATTEKHIVLGWWQWRPRANIGLCTTGLFVLDVDPRNGGPASLERLIAEHGPLPRTLASITPSRGYHLFFRGTRPTITISAGRFASGLDVRSNRGYAVLPPSVRADGCYRWARGRGPDEIGMASTPEWLLDLAEPPARPDPPPACQVVDITDRLAAFAFDAEIEAVRSAPEGVRNETLFVAGRKLGRLAAGGKLSWTDVREHLIHAAIAAGLDQDETFSTVKSALRSRGLQT
jgi:hypothetical protein